MGQLALGFRSLLIRAAVFFIMAVLLAWALGGTLWPRAEIVDAAPVDFDGQRWFWRLAVGGGEEPRTRWTLMVGPDENHALPYDARLWREVTGPVATTTAIFYAGRASEDPSSWRLEQIEGGAVTISTLLPDRLAAEQQLARLRAGLPTQTAATILRERPTVLDPGRTNVATGQDPEAGAGL